MWKMELSSNLLVGKGWGFFGIPYLNSTLFRQRIKEEVGRQQRAQVLRAIKYDEISIQRKNE
jgi:hypothetical protein